jgi:ubiquinone/menaquinone biosynthesis C-methylase UbiE
MEGLHLRHGNGVLDLATGTGELARRCLQHRDDLALIGIDLSRPMLLRGQHKPGLRYWRPVQGDATRLPFAGGEFDTVLCANAFHHFTRPLAVLAEIRRVLHPGGLFVLTDWCDDYLMCKVCSVYLRLFDRSFYGAYTLEKCRGMLESAGFCVVSARKFKIDWLWGLMRVEAKVR